MGLKGVLTRISGEQNSSVEELLDFYNKKPSGNETMDNLNRWFYRIPTGRGFRTVPIKKIDASILSNGNLDLIFDGWGQTLMTSAVINGRKDLVDLLLKNGAKADAPNNLVDYTTGRGQMPIELAKDRARFNVPNGKEILSLLQNAQAVPLQTLKSAVER